MDLEVEKEKSCAKDFQIIKKLGEGSFSKVFLVKRLKDKKVYAMKTIKMKNISEKNRENSLNEIRILAGIQHPWIIGYKDSFVEKEEKRLNIIMEYCEKGDLWKKIEKKKRKEKRFWEEDLWDLLGQVVLAVDHLHKHNIYHWDLKSANIFLCKSLEG